MKNEEELRKDSGPVRLRKWKYSCIKCGQRWISDAGYPGKCPECGFSSSAIVHKNADSGNGQ